ncbi:MAG: type transport system ATP-binding protein [Blastocatellia bacterium]|nr:type transport system ATP-binding protein [Blastocatellia bacterium]
MLSDFPSPIKAVNVEPSTITLNIEHVTKRFEDFVAVNDLSLKARAGRIFGLLGPNGAGKTTMIRMIVNITAPDSGKILLFGQHMTAALQDRIGYLPEERGLYKRMKIGEQLRFFAELKNLDGREATRRIDLWLEKVKLSEWRNKKTMELSKGMQQKVQFIAAVLHDPELLILDEPFTGLDPISVALIEGLVLELKAAGKTIIFSTHGMEQAERICDDICLLNKSKKVLDGSLREVKSSFGRNAVALRVDGAADVLNDRSLVSQLQTSSDEVEAVLAEGIDSQELLRRILATGARISKFELVEPSLRDIFISKVGQTNE